MATIANLIIKISTKSSGITKSLNNTLVKIKNFSKKSAGLFAGIGASIGLAKVISFTALSAAMQGFATKIDKVAKTSAKLGTTTGALQKLQYQGELTGISSDNMSTALQRMVRRIAEAAVGTGEAKSAIAELGLNAQKLAQLSPEKQFYAIGEAMQSIALRGDQVRLTMKIFDTEGVGLVNTFNSNLAQTGAEFDKLGVRISDQQAVMVESFNDSNLKLSTIFQSLGFQMTAQLSEPFTKLINFVSDTILSMGGMESAANKFSQFMLNALISASKGVSGLIQLFLKLENLMLHIENIKLAPAVALDALGALDDAINKRPHIVSPKAQEAFNNVNQIALNKQEAKDNSIVSGLEAIVKELELSQQEQAAFSDGMLITDKHAGMLASTKSSDPAKDASSNAINAVAKRATADKNAAEKTNELAKAAGSAANALTPKAEKKSQVTVGMTGFGDLSGRIAATGISANLGDSPFFGVKGSGLQTERSKFGATGTIQNYINESPTGSALQKMREGKFGANSGITSGLINGQQVNADKPQTKITLNLVTKAGEVAGELLGSQEFIDEISNIAKKQTNKSAVMVGI